MYLFLVTWLLNTYNRAMILQSLYLQHFRSYTNKKFDFSDTFTAIIGPNTAGKTNMSEAISLLLTGKSFRSRSDMDMIAFGQEIGRVGGMLEEISNFKFQMSNIPEDKNKEKTKLEVVIASPQASGGRFSKKFFINGVAKSRTQLRSILPLILFRPEELDIIIDGPSLRREFLNAVLEQVDKEYYASQITYERSLRQRNALLRIAQETGRRNSEQFSYWDNLLIESGQALTKKRAEFLFFMNESEHDIFPLKTMYDKSVVSKERLEQYKDAEVGAGVTLVGPHRDDFSVSFLVKKEDRDIRHFGSRGQQRLAVLQLKMLQIAFVRKQLGISPLLVLDDIFSELDSGHIQLVLDKVKGCQVILTTTHKEFIPEKRRKEFVMIELENK